MKIFFESFRKNTCIFEIDVLIYAGRVSDEVNIRVGRSLVSRLNGVQEASSSNLDTRTKKMGNYLRSFPFFISAEEIRMIS